ncbi:MAG: LLM class flavin-dependent oxidoreductase [Dehalococcoidia bacterium]|nr:LLM class flavin-dependent oxidoreductase [Dehalococcoidia bacterium]
MHAGLYLNPQTPGPAADHAIIDAVRDHARLCHRFGYRAIWATEHAFTGYNAYSDPIVLAAHLSALVPDMWLGFSVAVAALHHPIRFATQIALLDNLTNGKLIAGVGSGVGPDEFAGFGLDHRDRHALFDTWQKIVIEAWLHEGPAPYTFDTPWWRGTMAGRIIPAPVQKPFPLLARATLTPEFARRQGRLGQPVLLSLTSGTGELIWNAFLDGLAEGDLTDDQRQRALEWTCFTQQTYVSDSPTAVDDIWAYSKVYLSRGVRANKGYDWAPPEEWALRKANYRKHTLLAGSPQMILDKLAPWAERGMGHVMIWAYFGEMPPAMAAETLQRFGEEVLPHLERICPATPSYAPVPTTTASATSYIAP